MPGFDGVELLERIHNLYPKMARLLLTGYDASEEVQGVLAAGSVELCLAKPVDLAELMSAIDRAIEARKARVADQ
jgi:response regulator RpfG family c-di-GMP phosphodiesterase